MTACSPVHFSSAAAHSQPLWSPTSNLQLARSPTNFGKARSGCCRSPAVSLSPSHPRAGHGQHLDCNRSPPRLVRYRFLLENGLAAFRWRSAESRPSRVAPESTSRSVSSCPTVHSAANSFAVGGFVNMSYIYHRVGRFALAAVRHAGGRHTARWLNSDLQFMLLGCCGATYVTMN